jgi:hypothetical protein
MLPVMSTPTSSPKPLHAVIGQFVVYRAEFNPLSGRWMVMSESDECIQAGLSKAAAEALADTLNQI